jgi:4-amino-4-deoxy-L-arabinose transferase-like glycosyltransferase
MNTSDRQGKISEHGSGLHADSEARSISVCPHARRGMPWWVLCLSAVVCLVGITDREVWTPDEPRAAAITLEMSRSGDYVVPHLAGVPFVEKPPLYFAVGAVFARWLGPVFGNTGAIRLSSAFWALGTLGATFLFARRLYGSGFARVVVVLLATMAGFVENMHWIRVDAALVFFVSAAMWALGEVYLGNRPWFGLPAGIFSAGAFLTKGAIGPLLILPGWVGMVTPWWRSRRRGVKQSLYLPHHLLALAFFLAPVVWWMVAFQTKGGQDLWHAWFYENHFGRLMGTAPELGHIRRNPLYYVQAVTYYTLPWLPVLGLALFTAFRDLKRTRTMTPARIALLAWSLGSILLLTVSKTKREIYLAPVLPALAILCAEGLGDQHRWLRVFWNIWMGICLTVLGMVFLSPLWAGLLPASVPDEVTASLRVFDWRHAVVGGALGFGALSALGRLVILQTSARVAVVTALFFIGLFAVPAQTIDADKSLKSGIELFVAQVPPMVKVRTAAWNLSETDLAALDYYGNWAVSADSRSRTARPHSERQGSAVRCRPSE